MPTFDYHTHMDVTPEELYSWHARPGALERLLPPWQDIRVIDRTGDVCTGRVTISMPAGPGRVRWVAQHRDCHAGRQFIDEQVKGPFSKWIHTHLFENAEHGSVLHDHIDYRLPLGPFGAALGGGFVRRSLDQMFRFRHSRTRADLARHARVAASPRLRVLIGGGSGLVGGMLRAFLTTGGHRADVLVRRGGRPYSGEVSWDPAAGKIDSAAIEGTSAVVQLSGQNIAERWTPKRKKEIRESRVQTTRVLCEALAKLKTPPKVLVAASAIGFYGNRGDEILTEDSPRGPGYLPELCEEWEAATEPARQAGIRVVNLRIGVVISGRGGALKKMLTPFRLGAGGRIGSGQQWMSWISADDLVYAIHECLFNPSMSGPVNAVAAHPVRQIEFARTLARLLHRPAIAPLPAPAVRLLFGEMGQAILLEGARVSPAKLESSGFVFTHPTLERALRAELGMAEGH